MFHVKNFLKIFKVILKISLVAVLFVSSLIVLFYQNAPEFQMIKRLNMTNKPDHKRANIETSQIRDEGKCNTPSYKGLSSLLNYIDKTNYNCMNLSVIGGKATNSSQSPSLSFIDGSKYVCFDSNIGFQSKNCLVYSFGIKDEWSFDDKMAEFGCNVFSFDPTMGKPDHKRSEQIQFYDLGIADHSGTQRLYGKMAKVSTFRDILVKLGHTKRKLDYLKIDIEGNELAVFNEIFLNSPELLTNNVVQIGMEIHLSVFGREIHLNADTVFLDRIWKKIWKMLHQLECLGFRLTNNDPNLAHGVIYHHDGRDHRCCYELLYINSKLLQH